MRREGRERDGRRRGQREKGWRGGKKGQKGCIGKGKNPVSSVVSWGHTFSSAICRASLFIQWSWWEDGDSLPRFNLLCFSSHFQPIQGFPEKDPTLYPIFYHTGLLSNNRGYSKRRALPYIFLKGDTLENESSSCSNHRTVWKMKRKMREKREDVTTYQHEWWHTAPSVAAPGPTSRLVSASTASQGVGRIHSPPLLSLLPLSLPLSLRCRTSSRHPSFPDNLASFCYLIQFSAVDFFSSFLVYRS